MQVLNGHIDGKSTKKYIDMDNTLSKTYIQFIGEKYLYGQDIVTYI